MNLIEIFSILLIHWIGDFVLQTDRQARGKSKNWDDLLSHTMTYSFVWFIPIFFILFTGGHYGFTKLNWSGWIGFFPIITFVFHTITDYFTSRLNSKLWAKGDVHNFFVSIGFDQILHYVQLFLTYYYLKS